MNIVDTQYKIATANEEDIFTHLNECNYSFNPPLNEKVSLPCYSKKIAQKAITFEAWESQNLVGLVAAYFNDFESGTGYITSVSLIERIMSRGIASKLLTMCIDYARRYNFGKIELEVFRGNTKAVSLYKKFSFTTIGNRDNLLLMKLEL